MSDPSAEKIMIVSAFEQLPTKEKLEVFEDIAYSLGEHLSRFNDPVFEREVDIISSLAGNLQQRLEEIAEIYGVS